MSRAKTTTIDSGEMKLIARHETRRNVKAKRVLEGESGRIP